VQSINLTETERWIVFVAIDGSQFLSRLSRTYLVRRPRHAGNELVTITSPNRVVSSIDLYNRY